MGIAESARLPQKAEVPSAFRNLGKRGASDRDSARIEFPTANPPHQ